MLSVVKKVTINGNSTINGAIAATYSASIDSDNPQKITMSNTNINATEDAATRQECRADYAQFLQTVYDKQDAMIAEKAAAAE